MSEFEDSYSSPPTYLQRDELRWNFMRVDLKERTIRHHDLIVARTSGRTLGGLRPGERPIDTDLEVIDLGIEAPGPIFEPYSWKGFPEHIPRTYVRCLRDQVITPELVDIMVANMGGAKLIDIDAGHDVASSAPIELAALLDLCASA